MIAGRLRHRIQLQRATEAVSSSGDPSFTWATYATVWAAVTPVMSAERSEDQQVTASVTHEVRMRYYNGVITTDHVVFNGRTLEVTGVINVNERSEELILTCVEVV